MTYRRFPAVPLAALLAAGLLVSACGRRGLPEPPPGGHALPGDEAPPAAPTVAGAPVTPGDPRANRQPPRYAVPKEPFVLDPLL